MKKIINKALMLACLVGILAGCAPNGDFCLHDWQRRDRTFEIGFKGQPNPLTLSWTEFKCTKCGTVRKTDVQASYGKSNP